MPIGTMKLMEAIWMAIACAASEAAPISPIRRAAALKIQHFEGQDASNRQAEPHEPAKARPIGPPEASEQMVATETALYRNDDRQPDEHHDAGQRGGEPGAGDAHLRKAEIAEDQAPIGEGIEGHRETTTSSAQRGRSSAG